MLSSNTNADSKPPHHLRDLNEHLKATAARLNFYVEKTIFCSIRSAALLLVLVGCITSAAALAMDGEYGSLKMRDSDADDSEYKRRVCALPSKKVRDGSYSWIP